MSKNKKVIQVSDEILGGTPVFRGTRVPVQTLMDYLGHDQKLEDFLLDFPTVKRAQAVALIEIAKTMVLQHARAA